ncbi:MAG: hypothetical protein NVS2B4_18420 [Ramlibacter sp.]
MPAQSAVVDFLFHPEAVFWADHHATTNLKANWSGRPAFSEWSLPTRLFDPNALSCAGLLQRELRQHGAAEPHFEELAAWADRTDAALYASVEEAIFPRASALRISASLATAAPDACIALVRLLSERTLDDAATDSGVVERLAGLRARTEKGLERVRESIEMRDGIAVFVASAEDAEINRYSPYWFVPDARYSVGLVLSKRGAKITTMRNPWLDFPSVHLGKLSEDLGGGGHQRVGAIFLEGADEQRGRAVMEQLVGAIEREEQHGAARRNTA